MFRISIEKQNLLPSLPEQNKSNQILPNVPDKSSKFNCLPRRIASSLFVEKRNENHILQSLIFVLLFLFNQSSLFYSIRQPLEKKARHNTANNAITANSTAYFSTLSFFLKNDQNKPKTFKVTAQ